MTNSFRKMAHEEQDRHHGMQALPSGSASPARSVAAPPGTPGMMEGVPAGPGMMQGMEKMMEGMGRPPPKQLYPSLMSLPKIGPEDRAQFDRLAQERMSDGLGLMNEGVADLSDAVKRGNWEKAQDTGERVRQGV